jgi:rhodanese-related sulfurtransferase
MNITKQLLLKSGVSSSELEQLLNARAKKDIDFLLIDVREESEYISAHIAGVDMLMPISSTQSWMGDFLSKNSDKNIVFTCRSGNRSGQISSKFRALGVNAVNHLGGIITYKGKIAK